MTLISTHHSDSTEETRRQFADDVARALRSIDALGDAIESLPTHVSPQAARAVQATENLIRDASHEFGMLTASEVGRLLGSSSKAARNLAGSRHRSGELLAIRRGNRDRFPGFQFGPDGTPLLAIRGLRAASHRHGWSESDLFLWLVAPAGSLDGRRPVEFLLSGPESAHDRVLAAAELEMSTEW